MAISITVSGTYQAGGGGAAVKRLGATGTGWYLTSGYDAWKSVSADGESQPLVEYGDVIRAVADVLEVACRTGLHVTYQSGLRPEQHEWWPPTHLPIVRTA